MFKKPKRNFANRRQTVKNETSDDEESSKTVTAVKEESLNEEETSTPVPARPSLKNTSDDEDEIIEETHSKTTGITTTTKNISKLSFVGGDDEEDEVSEFKVKKSNYSKRMSKQLEKERKKRQKEMAEKEEQVRKMQENKVSMNNEESVRKRMERERLSECTSRSIDKQDEVEIFVPEEDHLSDDSQSEFSETSPKFRPILERGSIPDANLIFKLKKQRQQRRAAEEFISLITDAPSGSLKSASSGNEKESGCVVTASTTGEGEEDDEEFGDDRIDIRLDHAKTEREAAREAFLAAQVEEDERCEVIGDTNKCKIDDNSSDSDDEIGRWEQEQIMKGVGAQHPSQVKAKVEAEVSSSIMDIANSPSAEFDVTSFDKKISRINQLPSHLCQQVPDVSFEQVIDKLQTYITQSQEHLSHLERQLVQISAEEKLTLEEKDKLEEERKHLEETRLQQWQQLQSELKKKQLDTDDETVDCTNGSQVM